MFPALSDFTEWHALTAAGVRADGVQIPIEMQLSEESFDEFDWHVCSLLATTALTSSLTAEDPVMASLALGMGDSLALGMGAAVSTAQLMQLEELGVNLAENVETRDGRCPLPIVLAKSGHFDALESLLEHGSAELDCADGEGCTPLMCASMHGHLSGGGIAPHLSWGSSQRPGRRR